VKSGGGGGIDEARAAKASAKAAAKSALQQRRNETTPMGKGVNAMNKKLEREKVRSFLAGLDLEQYCEKICDEGYDTMRRLLLVESVELKELGMKAGHRKQLLQQCHVSRA
jgi:hypothetical protein